MPKKKKKPKEEVSEPPKKKSLTFAISDQFRKDYIKLSKQNQEEIDSTLKKILEYGDFTTGMKPRKYKGSKDIWHFYASINVRVTFNYLPDNKIFLRRCGVHKINEIETRRGR